MTYLLTIAFMSIAGWYWLDSARARELATELARALCEKRGVQFLDETVTLSRTGLRWTSNGLRIRRLFRVEYSVEGMSRRCGHILLLGTQVESVDLGLPQDNAIEPEPPRAPDHNKVIRFPGRRKP